MGRFSPRTRTVRGRCAAIVGRRLDEQAPEQRPLVVQVLRQAEEQLVLRRLTAGPVRAAFASVPGITGVTITIPVGRRVRPLPDGDQYLGFVFAEGGTPAEVETALTTASQRLRAVIG